MSSNPLFPVGLHVCAYCSLCITAYVSVRNIVLICLNSCLPSCLCIYLCIWLIFIVGMYRCVYFAWKMIGNKMSNKKSRKTYQCAHLETLVWRASRRIYSNLIALFSTQHTYRRMPQPDVNGYNPTLKR